LPDHAVRRERLDALFAGGLGAQIRHRPFCLPPYDLARAIADSADRPRSEPPRKLRVARLVSDDPCERAPNRPILRF
jgi:hypothetical protein